MQTGRDGKGQWVDNVFVERLWRSVKYEDGYLQTSNPEALRLGLAHYFRFSNMEPRHQALNRRTPDVVYGETPEVEKGAYWQTEISLIELSKNRDPLLF